MFDRIDAAFWDPFQSCAWLFRGSSCARWNDGIGLVPLSGVTVRTLGVDAWSGIPDLFRQGIDAAFYYPSRAAYYFFKDGWYTKLALTGGWVAPRQVGVDGWATLPPSFRTFDTAFFYESRQHGYFFRGDKYVKYKPGQGVVPLNGSDIRDLRVDGWVGLPFDGERLDAVIDYAPNESAYFFCGREYARWQADDGIQPRYPRTLGLAHGIDLVEEPLPIVGMAVPGCVVGRGGWPGLGHVVAGPIVGSVTPNRAVIWIWLSRRDLKLQLVHNGVSCPFTVENPVDASIASAVDAIYNGSVIQNLIVCDLEPGRDHRVDVVLGSEVLEQLRFRTPPDESETGRVRIFVGSCSDFSKYSDAPAFESAARLDRKTGPDLALLVGDNCYYVNENDTTTPNGQRPYDWESAHRMLLRQLQARNHPQFVKFSRGVAISTTWDDHDFADNNSFGTQQVEQWVGRGVASSVFRAFWPNPYTYKKGSVEHVIRWGPVEIFVTDTRYHKAPSANMMWGNAQLATLLDGLRSSTAPVKIVVVATQFLVIHDDEGHLQQAVDERHALLDAILQAKSSISGHVLFVSGDIHGSELLRLPAGDGQADVVEMTSSPLRRDVDKGPTSYVTAEPFEASRVWGRKRDGFVMITVDLKAGQRGLDGTIRFQAFDAAGTPTTAVGGNPVLDSTWNLATRVLSTP